MKTWELKLKVRRFACEGRLGFARERHGDLAVERSRSPEGGEMHKKKSDKMALLRWQIRRELDEIKFVKALWRVGPMVGNNVLLAVPSGKGQRLKGLSIIELIQRESDKYHALWQEDAESRSQFEYEDGWFENKSLARGLDEALRILSNPYLFLDRTEKLAYDKAEQDEEKIVKRRAGEPSPGEMILPGTNTAATLAKAKASDGGGIVVRRRSDK